MSSLSELTEQLLVHVRKLEKYATANELSSASFETDVFQGLPAELQESRSAAVDISQTIRKLTLGPEGIATDILFTSVDLAVLRIIYLYKIPHTVPTTGSATYEEISNACGLSQSLVYRILRHSIANRIFCESSLGHVSHTATSRVMLEDPEFIDNVGMLSCEVAPAFAKFPEALTKFPDSEELEQTAWSLSNDTNLSLYAFLVNEPERARRFGQSMKYLTKGSGFSVKHITTTYDWKALDRPGTTMVDIGGGHGSVSQHLADYTTHMRFIVQDLPSTAQQGREILPAKYKSRIEFAGHDYYSDQTIKDKEIYFFRWIFHNQSDQYCVKILKALVPAMKVGTRVLINETVLPATPPASLAEKMALDSDLIMAACFNGRERNVIDWRSLFERADPRFSFKGVTDMPGCSMSLIETIWEE